MLLSHKRAIVFHVLTFLFFVGMAGVRPASGAIPIPEEPRADTYSAVNGMKNGTIAVIGENETQTQRNREHLAKLAKFVAYRIARPPYNGEPAPRAEKGRPTPENETTMQWLMNESDRMAFTLTNLGLNGTLNPMHYQYVNEFGKEIQKELKYVLEESSKPIERLNAVRMMSLAAAKLPYPGFATTFMEILKSEKYSDALRVYAFQGLRNVLSHSTPNDTPPKNILPLPQLVEISDFLQKYILQYQNYEVKPGEEEQARVVQFVRRYAIQALGQFKESVLRNRDKEILARPGLALINVVSPSNPKTLQYSYAERIDAVIGFCHMRTDESVNLEAATFWINEGLIDITNFENDEQVLVGKVGGRPTIPWKISAVKLVEALNAWRKNMDGVKVSWQPAVVGSYVEKAIPVFEKIEKEGLKASVDARELGLWRKNREPKDRIVFREQKKDQ